ncbi:MAG: carbohydrate kinase family protein [Nitrososphaeria archaeon]
MARIFTCGFVVVDILAAGLPKIPEPGEGIPAPLGIKFSLGGHPANVSVDLEQLDLKRGDVRVALAAGRDMFGDFIQGFLRSRGVVGRLQRVKDAPTGISLLWIKTGEDKRVVIMLGANLFLDFNYVMRAVRECRPKILYVASGVLGNFDFRLKDLLEYCHNNNIRTVLDLTTPYQKEWNYSHSALPYVDVLHSNVEELQGITGQLNPLDGLRWVAKMGVKCPIVSDGKNGSTLLFKGKFIKQPAFDVKLIDPSGAGDAMTAGTVRKLLDVIEAGRSIEDLTVQEAAEILLFAQATGGACVEEIGTTPGVNTEHVNRILDQQRETVLSKTTIVES